MGLMAAFRAFWQALKGEELVAKSELDKLREELSRSPARGPTPAPATPPKGPDRFGEGATYALVLLQREGRLVDFLQEDIAAFDDAQVGAAVRQIHENCRQVLQERFGVEPLQPGPENEQVTIPAEFDAQQVRLTGNVPPAGPYQGWLRHRGWRAARVKLPERQPGADITVIQPAEVEI